LLKKENTIFGITSQSDFESHSLALFRHQYANCRVYKEWADLIKCDIKKVTCHEQIPFLPIEFFKTHQVLSSALTKSALEFSSSATTSQVPAKHYVTDPDIYERSFTEGFRIFYGEASSYRILALLPSYLERAGSSLVYMCRRLMELSGHPENGFYLNDQEGLLRSIEKLNHSGENTLLIGVSYALLDLADKGVKLNDNFTVMETGGMKGRRKELLKPELHARLKKSFGLENIHSEYGMTELLSQAYSRRDGLFECPPWMKILVREVDDPLVLRHDGKTGGINVIDLANINSCAFIATKDLGRINPDGRFELMGRYDHSDVRGCNLMAGDL
jgi:hypothetical protein